MSPTGFDLRRDIEFNTRVKEASFDSQTSTWTVKTDKGHTATARFCIMATGNLSTPRTPNYPGLERFKGKWYHTGLWPHEGVDFTGLRVGVIGTGSSGVQSIPIIAKQAKHLYVFQRTANFSLPARNGPMDSAKERAHKAQYPERRRAAFDTPFEIAGYPPPVKSALDATEAERRRACEVKWVEGGSISFLYSYTDLLLNKESNQTASEFVRQQIRRHSQGSQNRGAAVSQRSSDRHQTVDPRYRLLRGLQSRQRDLGGYQEQADHRDYVERTAHNRCRLRARCDRLCNRLRCHDRGVERDRYSHGCRNVDQSEVGSRPTHLPRDHDRRISEPIYDYRPAEPRRQKSDDIGLRAAR